MVETSAARRHGAEETFSDGNEADPDALDYRRVQPDRIRDPLRTQQDILAVATTLFAEHGLSGARIDQISELTQTTKRMIYYYFGSKEGLYEAVLERAYLQKWHSDGLIDLAGLGAVEALRHLVGCVFDNLRANPTFAGLVAAENVNRGRFLGNLRRLKGRVPPIVRHLETILERGREGRHFRGDADPWQLYWLINACCVYGIVGSYTFDCLAEASARPQHQDRDARHRATAIEAVMRWAIRGESTAPDAD